MGGVMAEGMQGMPMGASGNTAFADALNGDDVMPF